MRPKLRCQWITFAGTAHNGGMEGAPTMHWCEVCGRWSRLSQGKRDKLGACPGRQPGVARATRHGHLVASWAILSGKWSGRTLYGCTRCAATGMTHFVHLKQKCTGQAKGHRIWVAKQLQDGRHPNGKDVVARIPGIQLLGRGRRAEERWRRSSAGQPAGRDPGPDHNRSDPGGPEWSPAGEGALHTKPPAPRDPGTDQSRIDPFGPEWSPVGEGELDEPSEAGAGCTEAWIEPPQWEC
jgi:hypothetical protein